MVMPRTQQAMLSAFLVTFGLFAPSFSFVPSANNGKLATGRSCSPSSSSSLSSAVETIRPIDTLQQWAVEYCGMQFETGFGVEPQEEDLVNHQRDQWHATTSTGGSEGSRVLFVPSGVSFSAAQAVAEFQNGVPGFVDIVNSALREAGSSPPHQQLLFSQFALMARLAQEYERGQDSPWFAWFQSLPRTWTTAASMDDFCLTCLPPFLKSLATRELKQVDALGQVLRKVLPDSNVAQQSDSATLQFLYNVVRTRSFLVYSEALQDYDIQIVPVADMINHGDPSNAALYSDQAGACHVVLTQDVPPGTPLSITYNAGGGTWDQQNDVLSTNPSRCLALYGFLHPSQTPPVATYCKLMYANPSPELRTIGYEPSKLLFYTRDGSVSPHVWDVILFALLERQPELRPQAQQFYQAHLEGDEETKAALHNHHMRTTVKALQRHVDGILAEIAQLRVQTNAYDSSRHPRLPLIQRHNDFVWDVFCKTREYLKQLEQQV